MRGITRIVMLGAVGLAVLSSSSIGSWAAPRRSTLLGGECNCKCFTDGVGGGTGVAGLVTGLSNSIGGCTNYNNRTCNVEDPSTGGIRSGKTGSCCQVQDNGTCIDYQYGSLTVVKTTNLLNATLTTTTTTTTTTTSPTTTTTSPTRTQTNTTATTSPQ